MKTSLLAALCLALLAAPALATAQAARPGEQPWTYRAQRLSRAQLDKLLQHPESLLLIDVRRPDEVSKIGGFPVYLSVQAANLEASLPFIPKDRVLVTISNRAHRAGAAADLLASKGYSVAGAVGTKDYEEQGGAAVTRIAIPPLAPATASANAAPPAAPSGR